MNNLSPQEQEKVGQLMMVIQAANLKFKIKDSDAKYLAYAFIACGIMTSRFKGMSKEDAELHFKEVAAEFADKDKVVH